MPYQIVRFTSQDDSDYRWGEPYNTISDALPEARRIVSRGPCVVVDTATGERMSINEAEQLPTASAQGGVA